MGMFKNDLRVAISDDFLEGLNALPRNTTKKVQKFIRQFRSNPTSSAHNYEKINNATDPNMRSVRIDGSYRAIVLKPEQGNIYVLLWVDNHDEAYRWAERKRCVVHPDTGSLQLFSVDEEEYVDPAPDEAADDQHMLFDEWRDRNLAQIGIPEELLPVIRKMRDIDDLETAAASLPDDAYEALFWLTQWEDLNRVYKEIVLVNQQEKRDEVDTDDFEAALENIQSQRKFVIVEDDEDLERILEARLEKWRIFLHPSQHKMVHVDVAGPVRVLGGAGTGKTVVAMHRAAYLAEELLGEDDRILFTTFTKNLASDIEENLKKLCSDDAMKRIEVRHLDKWVHQFLRSQGYDQKIKYYQEGSGILDELWRQAMESRSQDLDLPRSFYREEWERVIQALGCTRERDYLRARRKGRGTPLKRSTRRKIWPVFKEYRNLMSDRGLRERDDAIRDARKLLETSGDILPYRALVLDEAQDMGAEAFKLIRTMIPEDRNDLFIVGDGHQRIYRHPVVMKHCGINIVGRKRSFHLKINYRTTDEIRKYAVGLLEGWPIDDLDGGEDWTDEYKSLIHGVPPQVSICDSWEDEIDAIIDFIIDLDEKELTRCCLVVRTKKQRNQYQQALEQRGLDTYLISRDEFDRRKQPGLRLATMHRVKGLEFDRVIAAGINDGTVPLALRLHNTDDPAVKREVEMQERALFYVALTRARRAALITAHGEPSEFLHGH